MSAKIDLKLIIALIGVALIWGTTYLGIRIAVKSIPPWYVTAIRQTIASLIILAILVKQGELKWIGWPALKRQLLLSLLMVVIANGMTTVAEKTIPSGLTSLINATSPLLVFLGCVFLGIQKPSAKGFIGVFIGFLGIVFIFREGIGDLLEPGYRNGILSLVVAVSGWTIGTIYSKKHSAKPQYIFLNLFYQFSFSALVQLGLAVVFSGKANVSLWKAESIFAAVYLAVFGSVLGYFCYHYALKKVSASEVSILTYFNTIIAIFLGWLVLNEHVDLDLILATVLIITGVVITNYKRKSLARE
ncbi:DMT family transporter [Pedobacter endophyticus]|uniref:EamA family transporter n=1 Tax=Pedobacter endophyticus TaxID=2789740 RepID=A0A7S9PYK6_9SPHI|nr:EamA family transporter [Pedobacter endophyticus]QPH39428.1 EamA family transporter [Pedobacter endophyticus]